MESTRNVKGLAELQKFLDSLPAKVEKNIMRGALRAGATVIRNLARSKIHHISGRLAASIRVTTMAKGKTITARIVAGGAKSDIGNRPIWVEYGTRPHLISVQESEKPINSNASQRAAGMVRVSMSTINRNLRRVLSIGGKFVGPTVSHPGARPRPFMRPALDQGSQKAVVVSGEFIKARLTKEGLDASEVKIG